MNRTAKEKLAARLRFARDLAGLTQAQCAEALGIKRESYTKIELGDRDITALELIKLARFMTLDMSDLMTPQPLEEAFPLLMVTMNADLELPPDEPESEELL